MTDFGFCEDLQNLGS